MADGTAILAKTAVSDLPRRSAQDLLKSQTIDIKRDKHKNQKLLCLTPLLGM
jgi:hypothetical protein